MYNWKQRKIRQRRLCEIIQCIKEGMSTRQIAEELGVSVKTIQRDIKYIRENQEEE